MAADDAGSKLRAAEPGSRQAQVSMRTALSVGAVVAVLLSAAIVHVPWSLTSRTNIADLNTRLNNQVIRSIAEKEYVGPRNHLDANSLDEHAAQLHAPNDPMPQVRMHRAVTAQVQSSEDRSPGGSTAR